MSTLRASYVPRCQAFPVWPARDLLFGPGRTRSNAMRGVLMRKRIVEHGTQGTPSGEQREWLDLEPLIQIEVTSEDPAHPIQSALVHAGTQGWRADGPGEQTIRLLFDEPAQLRGVRLVFSDELQNRTQEFVLRWSADGGHMYQEIVRQQYTFRPPGTVREIEEYAVDLGGVTTLELRIVPDIGGGDAVASLERMRLASK
jgi:hypothetical protein